MRSETEIRSEVSARLWRRSLWLLDAGLGALTVFLVYMFTRYRSFGEPWASIVIVFLFGWFMLGIVHTTYFLYVEIRERLVHSAIERERQFYLLRENYEKQKRSEAQEYDDSRLRISDDGELIDYPAYPTQKVKADYEP